LKQQKLEKKLEDDDPDYVPNIFDAADLEDEGVVSNQKPSPETIAVLGKDSDTVSDGMQDIAPVVDYLLFRLQMLLLQDIILLKLEELVSVLCSV
jgi:hypothetical protein